MSVAAKPPAGAAVDGPAASRAPRLELRSVVHLNVANFAVAVERGVDCRLRDWPVIVAPEGAARAVVYDMSEEAYQAGIRKGMALRRARRRCRDARLLAPHFDRYERAMRALQARALPLTPQVEVVDEAGHLFLDLSGTSRLHGPPRDVAWRLRRQIRDDLGLDPIWSLAPNKLVAKVATRLVKPDGEYLVEPGEERRFLAPVPVHLLPGLERDQLALLRELNLMRAADVARLPLGRLEEAFGADAGLLHDTVRGVDPSPVLPAGRRQGRLWLDHEFGEDQHHPDVVEAALFSLVERAGRRLRQRRLGARRVGLQLDYSDGLRSLGSASRREATANDFALGGLARAALGRAWTRRVRLRHLRLVCDRLAAPSAQLSLLPGEQGQDRRQEQVVGALDSIRQRFGVDAIRVGRTLASDPSSPPHPITPAARCLMVPLVVHSHYSLMWGASSIPRLCRAARERGYDRLALTDTDNLYGLWPFLKACRAEGLRPLVGAELTEPASSRRAVCLVEDAAGFSNLCRLITRRQREGEAGFDLGQAVAAGAAGLTVLTAHPQLMEVWRDAGVSVAASLPRRASVTPARVRRVARRLGLPMVAVPGAWFADPADHAVHRVLRAMALKVTLPRLGPRDVAPADAWLAEPARYRRRFEVDPATLRASEAIAERCAFTGPDHGTVLPPWDGSDEPAQRALRLAAYRGARRRYGDDLSEAAVERLEHELRLIEDKGFSAYFLVVQQIVRRSPRVCGRGSGAASLVAYCLGITNVCPLKHDLYFERFLNPGRTDPPDIDIDFAWDERDDVLAWVLRHHGDHAAMVCNHVAFRPRMAIREVARTFGLGDREISRVVQRLPSLWHDGPARGPWVQPRLDGVQLSYTASTVREPRRRSALDVDPPWPEVLELAARVVGTPRLLSVHPGGMVITPRPVSSYAPVELAVKEVPQGERAERVPIVQWEKDGTEDSGLVKIDLLGNRSLAVIRDAVANAAANERPLDEARWEPEDDPATQDAVARGATMGCFYIESPAMRQLQQKTGKGDFEHLVIHSSIIRPAANEFIREYVRRLKGGAWEPIHPLLEDVLDETFGIMVYQEDVSRTAVALAGFSHAEADGLRKILSKKDREQRLARYARRFAEGARARGVSDEQLERVWAMMMSFEGYSFCKPHSASYARVSFQAAYLKVHYPAEFMAAVIKNGGGFYSTFAYASEARRMGITVDPPCARHGPDAWLGNGQRLQVGLMSVKGLGLATRERITAARQRQPFASMEDFLARARPDAEEARSLVHAGACDALAVPGEDRSGLLWRALAWGRKKGGKARPARGAGGRTPASLELFARPAPSPEPPPLPRADGKGRLRRQFAALGFLCDRHPMELFARALRGRGVVKARELGRHVGRRVRCAGWLITGKLVPTKKGEPMEFLTFEDETGLMETTFFPRAYRAFCHILDWNRPFLIHGKVEQDHGAITLTVDRAERLTGGA